MNLAALTRLFQNLGATDPAGWARSQVEEGINQLARFLFLRQAWRSVVAEGDKSWMQQAIEYSREKPGEPYAGVGQALERLRALGARDEDLIEVVRGKQAELLFHLCYLLEEPGDLEPEVVDMRWSLFQVDEEGNALSSINGLHESVLETDPTGREMRPR